MKRFDTVLFCAIWLIAGTFIISGCAEFMDFVAAAWSGGKEVAPAAPHVPGALSGNPQDIINITSYVANAALAAWGTWERRRRKKAATVTVTGGS